jgi:hypothetical protein
VATCFVIAPKYSSQEGLSRPASCAFSLSVLSFAPFGLSAIYLTLLLSTGCLTVAQYNIGRQQYNYCSKLEVKIKIVKLFLVI